MSTTKEDEREVVEYKGVVVEIRQLDKYDKELSKVLHEEEQEFGLGNDTYAMAFKALHWDVAA